MAAKRKLSGAAAAAHARKANGGASSSTSAAPPGPTDAPVTADPAIARVQRAFAPYAVLSDDTARAAAKVLGDATAAATKAEDAHEDPDATARAVRAAIEDAAGVPLVSIDACVDAYHALRSGRI